MQSLAERAADVCAPLAYHSVLSTNGTSTEVQFRDIVEVNGINFGTDQSFVAIEMQNTSPGL
jgi:hypothetical protein